ncbi:hypothetical protein [Vulcanisaeta sp. JCM 16161]|uniref:hypothetical protein n=1 Tax=Vulcanisaeta sp. JCM 16161 TaxID=1295372 RepID=UPI000A8C7C8D|nr:hypothetical protein [Vulcanisaeta sp. JCM 16161]
MRSKINSRVDVDVINMFINSLTWGYRRYNYWQVTRGSRVSYPLVGMTPLGLLGMVK